MSSSVDFARIGGHVALDFTNTAGGSTKSRDIDRLSDYRIAIRWARSTSLVTAAEQKELHALADALPREAIDQLSALRAARENSCTVLRAIANGRQPQDKAIVRIADHIKEAIRNACLMTSSSTPYAWIIPISQAGLSVIRHRAALTVGEILTSNDRLNVRECEACSWLFLDRSPSKRRRWCSMAACGNRAKARRHYHKLPGGSPD